jgi:hypothetical protein
VRGDVSVNDDVLLVIDFVNLNIKSDRFFGDAHRGRMYMRVLIDVGPHTYINICV